MAMSWCHVQSTQEEQRCHPECLVMPIAPTGTDDGHELGVHPFLGSVRDRVREVTDDVIQAVSDHAAHLLKGPQTTALGPADPGQEVLPGGAFQPVIPAATQVLLQGISLGRPQVAGLEGTDAGLVSLGEVLFPKEQGLAQSLQILTSLLGQRPHLILTDVIERLVGVGDDVKPIMNHCRDWRGEGFVDGLAVGLPHVHGNGRNSGDLRLIHGLQSNDQTGFRPVRRDLQDATALQVGQDRDVSMPLPDSLLINAQVSHDVGLSPTKATDDRPLHDATSLIPRDPQKVAGTLHGLAGQDRGDGTLLKGHREPTAGLRERQGHA